MRVPSAENGGSDAALDAADEATTIRQRKGCLNGNQFCNLATPAIAAHEPSPTRNTNENNAATGLRFGDRTSSDDRHSTPNRAGAPSHAGVFGGDRGKPRKSVRIQIWSIQELLT